MFLGSIWVKKQGNFHDLYALKHHFGSASLPRFGLTGGNAGQEKDALARVGSQKEKTRYIVSFYSRLSVDLLN